SHRNPPVRRTLLELQYVFTVVFDNDGDDSWDEAYFFGCSAFRFQSSFYFFSSGTKRCRARSSSRINATNDTCAGRAASSPSHRTTWDARWPQTGANAPRPQLRVAKVTEGIGAARSLAHNWRQPARHCALVTSVI